MQPLWCIIDANIILEAIRYKKLPNNQKQTSKAFEVIEKYGNGHFIWVYSQAILREYQIQFHILKKNVINSQDKRAFDNGLFNVLLSTIKQGPGLVEPSEQQNQDAYDTIMNPQRAEHLRDPDDYPYLSAAEEAKARGVNIFVLVSSEDSDLYTLKQYKGILIKTLDELLESLENTKSTSSSYILELADLLGKEN